jgi:hypothetical protein
MMTQIDATLIRPIVVVSRGTQEKIVALEVHSLNGQQFLVVLSRDGMKELVKEMQVFLREHPQS